jgi:Prp8 binding protein
MLLLTALWQTYGENNNIGILKDHSKAVTSIAWSPSAPRSSPRLFSASADGTLIVWNAATGAKERRLRGHKGIVNCVSCTRGGREVLVSGGDDGKVMLWDPQERDALDVLNVGYPVTAVCFSDDGSQVYVGGLDNDVHVSVTRVEGGLLQDQ